MTECATTTGSTTAAAGTALKSLAATTTARARGFASSAGKALNRAIYVSCYSVSYGVTFPTVLLLNVIPGGVSFATGVADGARAARDYVASLQHRSETAAAPPQETPPLASADSTANGATA
ncbi:MAG: hypothetical protein JSS02_11865 [Planctomycetes bacterium]|nr:hypothetical protein [Planctomycetota bacterium]